MTTRRSIFHAAWAAIVGLFTGGVASARAPDKLHFRIRVDGADEAIKSLGELQAKLDGLAAERDEWFAEWDAATDAEHYLMDGCIVTVVPHADEDGWDSVCRTHSCFAGGDTKEQAIQHLRECVAATIDWHIQEDVPLPQPDIDAKCLPSPWPLVKASSEEKGEAIMARYWAKRKEQ